MATIQKGKDRIYRKCVALPIKQTLREKYYLRYCDDFIILSDDKNHLNEWTQLGDFKPEHKGQMELYLRWLDKYEGQPGEQPSLGLILCSGKQQEQIELLELGQAGIHVAEYLTAFPSKEVLQERFHKAIKRARQRLKNQTKK